MRISLAQIDIAYGQPDRNQQTVTEQVQLAAEQGAEVVVFPEMWNTGYALTDLESLADVEGQQTLALLKRLAQQYQIAIVGGSVAVQRQGHFFNEMLVVNQSGKLLSRYDKVHLFGLMNEEKFITAGDADNQFTLAGVPATGVICYDIRFPEWLRKQVAQGPEILFVAAEWPTPRIAQWRILLQARAIENQAYVVAVNRVGSDPANEFGGQSMVIDPLGKVIAEGKDQAELITADLDFSIVAKTRGAIPVFADRRVDLY